MAKKDGTLDLRIRRTQGSIKKAFFELLRQQDFEQITVKDITERAGISRNTFYLHYTDKYDLFNKICDDLMRKMFFGVGKQIRIEQKRLDVDIDSAVRIMEYGAQMIDEDREAYKVLFECSASQLLTQKCSEVIRTSFDLIRDDISAIDDYSLEYIISGLTGLVKYHVINDIERVDEQIYNFVQLHLSPLVENVRIGKQVF